jgi:hypothetical protein
MMMMVSMLIFGPEGDGPERCRIMCKRPRSLPGNLNLRNCHAEMSGGQSGFSAGFGQIKACQVHIPRAMSRNGCDFGVNFCVLFSVFGKNLRKKYFADAGKGGNAGPKPLSSWTRRQIEPDLRQGHLPGPGENPVSRSY